MRSLVKPRDPLLSVARIVVGLFMGLFIFGAGLVAIGVVALLTVQREQMLAKLAANGMSIDNYSMVVIGVALISALLVIGVLFMREMLRIIGSVEEGNPFDMVNADRLRRMGWLTVGSQFLCVALAAIATSIGGYKQAILAEDALNAAVGGVLLALVLFILARVFRVGAAMREELEGTV